MALSWFANTNRLYYILVGVIGIVVLITVVLVLNSIGGGLGSGSSTTLQFWGVFDDGGDFRTVISRFEREHPGTRIRYTRFSFEDYERNLIDALAANRGPDIFMIHHSWLPKHGDKVAPMPALAPEQKRPLMTTLEFKSQFVDVAFDDLVFDNKIFAMPLYIDTLALYYNKDLLNTAGISSPPKDWDEFNSAVEKLTRLNSRGNIVQAGAAMGTAKNINRSTDILMALMIQSGTQMTNADNSTVTFSKSVSGVPTGVTSLLYYTDFANPLKRVYTWNDGHDHSIDGFVQGDTAMMFNYSHQADIIRSKSSRLNFDIAPMPQISPTDIKNYANYWAIAVANSSQDINTSWQFLVDATSKDSALQYLTETMRPSALREIIELQRNDNDLGVYAVQALTAKSWYQVDNVAIEDIFSEMIEDVLFGKATARDALNSAESRINVLMRNRKL